MPFTRLRQSLIKPNGSITGSLSGTSSYARRTLTASYALNASGGSISYITGSPVVGQYIVVSGSSTTQYALIQSVSNPEHLLVSVNGVVQNYSSSYTVTGSTLNFYQSYDDGDEIDVRFLNGGTTVQTGSIAKQTLWTNVTSGSTNTISGLSLSSNKWDVSVVEEWDAATLDQYYNSCSLLCHFDSINPAGRFIDNSRNNFAITSSGNVSLSDSQYKFGGASGLFDGTGDYLTIPSSTAFDFGAGGFTIEFWINTTQTTSNATLIGRSWGGSPYTGGWTIQLNGNSNSAMVIYWADYSTSSPFMTANTTSYRDGYWHHIAWVRSGTSFVLYIDGTSVATATNATSFGSVNKNISIGDDLTFGPRGYSGYVDELRITKGVARYTANFTPQTVAFPNSRNQVLTRYVGLVGGIDDKYVDYGVQKLSNSSLKLTRLTYPNQPIVGSGSLSGSVSRVYVNVLDYDNVSISGSISNAVTASYALTSATSRVALSASYLIPTSNNTTKAIFGYGYNGSVGVSMTNLVSNTGIVATDTTGVGTARYALAASVYGTDKAIFGYGSNGSNLSITNLVSNTGIVATDTTGVGTARNALAAASYSSDKAIFGYGITSINVSMTNLVSNTGVVATDTTGVGTARRLLAAAKYSTDKAIFGYGYTSAQVSMTNLVSNTGVVATDTTGVGTSRYALAAAVYGYDKAIFGYGNNGSTQVSVTNLISNTGVVGWDTTGVGTARSDPSATGYGNDKAIFGYGYNGSVGVSMTNLVSNIGIVTNDATGVGTARWGLAAAGYSTS
jgi:hypothetical protein